MNIMNMIKAYDYAITPIYTQDALYVTTKLNVVDVNNEKVESLNDVELFIKNRDGIRDLYRIGKEETLAYLLLRPFVDAVMASIRVKGFTWKEFLRTNPDFIPTLIDTMVVRIKEVMDSHSEYYTR